MVTPQTCPHCGTVLAPPAIFRGQKARVLEYIRKHPECNKEMIMDHLYANDPNGGASSNVLSVMIAHMRPTLKKHGLRILSRTGPGATYRLVKDDPE